MLQRTGFGTAVLLVTLILAGCSRRDAQDAQGLSDSNERVSGSDGPSRQSPVLPTRHDGDADRGRAVFRFETFGNEGFWTDAARLPAGMLAAGVTPLKAMQLGLFIDAQAVDPAVRQELSQELKGDPSGAGSAFLNDPGVMLGLVNANAIIGMPIKDSNGDGVLDASKGDKVGASCALCHTITDASIIQVPGGGSMGLRIDGPANHAIHMGEILASAANSRALYPLLQLSLTANKGKTIGRAASGLTETSSEAEVDAYLSNTTNYPTGMFDDTFDGVGNPMQNTPLFEQDLAAPFGSEGTIARLDNFSNLAYTALLDPTNLTTPGGRAFLRKLGGASGEEIADDYVKVLAATRVQGYPFLKSSPQDQAGQQAGEDAPLGIRVEQSKLLDLNAYLAGLGAPAGASVDAQARDRGRQLFRTTGCTNCHNVDQSKPVPTFLVDMKTIFPGDNPVILAQREPPLNAVQDTPGSFFDDKMIAVNATLRGEIRGIALPLLLDLARKPAFLHDKSVPDLNTLLSPSRGPSAPHPFYLSDPKQRADMAEFLRNLDTSYSAAQVRRSLTAMSLATIPHSLPKMRTGRR